MLSRIYNEAFGDKGTLRRFAEQIKLGDTIHFSIRHKDYNGKVILISYHTLKVEIAGSAPMSIKWTDVDYVFRAY